MAFETPEISGNEGEAKYAGTHWELESRKEEGANAAEEIQKRLVEEYGWNEDEVGLFGYAVDEAITNAIVYANWGLKRTNGESNEEFDKHITEKEGDPAETGKKIIVDISVLDDRVEAVVRSEVKTVIDPENIPDPTDPENLKRTSGRGIDTMIKTCDECYFNVPGEVKLVKLRKDNNAVVV